MAVSEDKGNAPLSVAVLSYQPVLDRVRSLPGIESAAMVTAPPLSGVDIGTSFEIVGRPKDPKNKNEARISAISGSYASTMGTPLSRGRMIGDEDVATTPFVAVINQALADKYFPGQDPLQKEINLGGKDTGMIKPYTIVGVLADQVDRNVGGVVEPLILLSQQQIPTTSLFYQALLKTVVSFVVKSRGEIPIAAEMRSVFHQLAPGFALDNFSTMDDLVQKNTFSQRLGLYLVGSFAGLAIVMVVAGLYGVLSQLVSHRRREIGIRIALGATRRGVVQMILRQGSIVIGSGLVIGLLLAFVTGRWVTSFLYQVKPLDTVTYVAVAVGLSVIGLMAALLPARKAASIEPMQALRED
jgi:predicted permease